MKLPGTLLLLLGSPIAAASCPITSYNIDGVVKDPEQVGVPAARMIFSWEESVGGQRRHIDLDTDANGQFKATVSFDTTARDGNGCTGTLDAVHVRITAESYHPSETDINPIARDTNAYFPLTRDLGPRIIRVPR